MIFWIGFTLMFFNEGFVMMRHVSPWFGRRRDDIIKKLGSNVWYRLHGTLDYTIKEGVNKNKIADEKILKSKK